MKNTVKTLLSGLTTLAVAFSAMSFTALATENKDTNDMTELIISSQEAYAGDIVTVSVDIKNNPGVRAITAVLNFDSNLAFVGYENQGLLSMLNVQSIDNRMAFGAVSTSIKFGDKTILNLMFEIPQDAEEGTIYDISWENVTQLSSGYSEIINESINGSIVVIEKIREEKIFIRGNIDGDGKVDVKDASVVLEYFISNMIGSKMNLTEEQIDAADVNGDGVVDVLDASLILEYSVRSALNPNTTWDDILNS